MSSPGIRRAIAAILAIIAGTNAAALAGPPGPAVQRNPRDWLLQVPEITLEETGKTAPAVIAEAARDWKARVSHRSADAKLSQQASAEVRFLPPQIPLAQSKRWEALGLDPITTADDRQLTRDAALSLVVVARFLRSGQLVSMPTGPLFLVGDKGKEGDMRAVKPLKDGKRVIIEVFKLRKPHVKDDEDFDRALQEVLAKSLDADILDAKVRGQIDYPVPALAQMLCAEDEVIRRGLVRELARRNSPRSSAALARLAVYDLAPSVRKAAVEALRNRPSGSYRAILLDGFRHPWPAAADHAAEAILAFRDKSMVPDLRQLLDKSDSMSPAGEDGKPVVRELVRVNHLKNCLLCHAPSLDHMDPVRGLIPRQDKPLPVQQYYKSRDRSPDDLFVRAGITYLRQDFSVMLPVKNAKPWPEMQRFDFLVRTRPATAEELAAQKDKKARSPQREAVLHALDGLR